MVVEAFLNNGVAFNEIPEIIESVLDAHQPKDASTPDSILNADAWARKEAKLLCGLKTPALDCPKK